MDPFTRGMDLLRRLAIRIRVLFDKRGFDEEMDEELRFHLEMEEESNLEKGMSPREARRQALLAFGGVERFKEQGREARGGIWVDEWSRDLRYALRCLRRRRAFTAAAVLVLGIGVGAISLMFSIFNTVVLQPLPYPEPDDLVWIWAENAAGLQNSLAYEDYLDYQGQVDALRSLGAYLRFRQTRILSGGERAEQVVTYRVSSNFFSTLGVTPLLGRPFSPEEEVSGLDRVTVLSYGFWQRRFGGDPRILGGSISMDGDPVEVVGIMPPRFDFPQGAEAWFPLERDASYAQGRGENNFFIVGRLAAGASIQQAQAQMDVIAQNIADAFPETMAGWRVRLVTLHDRLFGSARASILILIAIVSLVPMVACANVASLFMTRAVARRPELAARLALGASRWRVVRQLLAESMVVATGGAVAGLALAFLGAAVLRAYAPAVLPRLDEVGVDGSVLAVTLLASYLLVPLFGLLPARRGTELQINEVSRGSHGTKVNKGDWGLRGGLAVAQVALSLMLLAGSGLLVRSFLNLQAVPPGVESGNLLTLQALMPSFKRTTPEAMELAWEDARTRVQAIPGVTWVGFSDRAPLSGGGPTDRVYSAESPPASAAEAMSATRRFVSDTYFRTLRIPMEAGEVFEETDRFGVNPVVIINQTLARQHFPGEEAVGRTLVLDWTEPMELEVVGVVADVREQGLGQSPPPIFYLPARWDYDLLHLQVKTVGDPLEMAPVVTEALRESDPDIVVSDLRTLDDRISASLFEPRFRSIVVGVFAMVAVLLSLIGLYGVLSYYVRERSHEISVRLALGASLGGVTAWVLGRGMALVGIGIALGVVGALAGGRVVSSVLYGIESHDPVTLLWVSGVIALVGFAACLLPALRANRLDPAEALKVE